jgi:putative DNA primase/helicase
MDTFRLTDIGNGERFWSFYANNVHYIPETDRFVKFDSVTGWSEIDGLRLTKDVVRDMYREANECTDDTLRKELGEWAHRCEHIGYQRSMLEEAKAFKKTSIHLFDADPHLISCNNGVVDLRTKKLMPHSPDQLHLKRANASYDPKPYPLIWINFLRDITGDNWQLINWLQVALGYSIMGLTEKHLFFVLYGNGRNGKGTLVDTVGYILNDYAYTALEFDAFLEKDQSNVRVKEAKSHLKGIRFAVAAESSNSTRWNTALIKKLTGENMLEGAKLNRGSFKFKSHAKVWFECNHLPANPDASTAMRERVKIVPLEEQFTGDEQIGTLREDLKKETD